VPPSQPIAFNYPNYVQPMPQGAYPSAVTVDQDPEKAKRRRRLMIGGAAVVVLALVGVGVYALLPNSGNSVVAAVSCKPANLSSCLIQAPEGASRESGSGSGDQWPQQTESTADLYAGHITGDSPGISGETQGLLGQDGLRQIVHNDWTAVDGNSVDIVLLDFKTQKGAQNWNATRSGEILSAYPGASIAIPGDTVEAHAGIRADSKGDFDAAYSTVVGRIVLNVAYSSPSQISVPDLKNWAGTELASLRTAPAPAADPAPSAAATEQVACGSGLQSCLMAEPGDGQAWTSPSDSRWVSGSTLTPAQFVHLWWESASGGDQQQVLSTFTADGVSNIAHEAWTVNSGYEQADIYLLQTVTAAGAAQLAGSYFNEPDWGPGLSGVSYTVPNASGTQAWHTNKTDSNGFIDFAYTTTVGNVIVFGWEYFYGSFDSGTANSWAEPQVDRVQASAQTVPMGLFSLAAPTLPAATPGKCAASGDCLIPLPAGATDTTSSSYQSGQNLTAAMYADRYATASSDDFNTWLTADGFVSGEHRSWTASNGATADAVLLKYGSPAEAHAAALVDYGANAPANRACTDSAVPDSLCLAAPVGASDLLQKETVRVLVWKGDYEVSVSVSISNSADLVQAYTWAQQQVGMLSSTS
jgi:multisubunit Na+/H+ antiporter MnhB subunit